MNFLLIIPMDSRKDDILDKFIKQASVLILVFKVLERPNRTWYSFQPGLLLCLGRLCEWGHLEGVVQLPGSCEIYLQLQAIPAWYGISGVGGEVQAARIAFNPPVAKHQLLQESDYILWKTSVSIRIHTNTMSLPHLLYFE